ncbi:MAG: alkaline phosphatase family protein [Candidatus Sulfotelmatobacter sp.]
MGRVSLLLLSLLVVIGVVLLSLNGCGAPTAGNHILAGKFQHIVIIFQENSTPDNLFHDPVLMTAGADIASSGIDSAGKTIPLTPAPLGTNYDLSHAHAAFVAMYNRGRMNGADKIPFGPRNASPKPPDHPQFQYVNPADVQPYFQMAEQYTFGDRMFQTNQGPSYPAHQFIISGTSAPSTTSASFVAENPVGILNGFYESGCTAPAAEYVALIDSRGEERHRIYPCADHPTLTDELNAKSIDWRYYTPSGGSIWNAPNAIEHMCGPNVPPPNATACVGPDFVNHVVLYTKEKPAPILTDITNNQLPTVSWVIPSGLNSDHAGATGNVGGPSWVASIVNAIGNSPYWANTAIIVTWDDWGGWYDHVPPFKIVNDGVSWGSGYVYGFRVPLIVISPYARPSYISHVDHDFGSILHFVEESFGLPSLGYADAYADDLSDCFNLHQTPLVFRTIESPLNADHFLHDTTPPTDPDDD